MTFACMSIFLPSSIESLVSPYFDNNTNIDLLRDDLIHPIISGNKIRKLKFNINEALRFNCKGIITGFGMQSYQLAVQSFL